VSTRALILILAALLLTAAHASAQSGIDAFVNMSDSPDPVTAGEEITFTVTVGSTSAGAATNVQLESAVPAQTTPVAATPSGTCEAVTPSTTVFKCELGTIEANASKTVFLVVRTAASATGTVTSKATITADAEPSQNQTNNTADQVTTVTSPPPPPPPPPPPGPPPPPPPPGPPPPPPPQPGPDEVPPAQVSGVRATVGNRSVVMRWRLPSDADFAHVVITRSTVKAADRVVYTGRGQDFADRRLRNGTLYMYELRTVDRSGNESEGVWVAATPRGARLFSPLGNALLSSPPLLRWVAIRGASYYNVQLYRGSKKILSAWPRGNHLKLQARWRFAGRPVRLQPGAYHWFVWPGRGPRSRSSYGPLVGRSSFVIVARH
jgi:uncharacterized repeat protein (TIGR01451 family)